MSLGHVLEIQPVCIPAKIGAIIVDVLHVLAPVDLDVRHLGFGQPPRQQATLAKLGMPVLSTCRALLRRQVKNLPPLLGSDKPVGTLEVVTPLPWPGVSVHAAKDCQLLL